MPLGPRGGKVFPVVDAQAPVTADQAAKYLAAYIARYRREHERLTKAPPDGAGFPAVIRSPYLSSRVISCLLATDGAAVIDFSAEPPNGWDIARGPALMVDYPDPDSRVPQEIVDLLKKQRIYGKSIGIYRICSDAPIPDETWQGLLPSPVDQVSIEVPEGPTIDVSQLAIDWRTLIERLTFGAYGPILDIHLPDDVAGNFWQPTIVRDLGFITADREHRRFFHYFELLRHVDFAAWDERTTWVRVKNDVRRDLEHAIAMEGQVGGTMSIGEAPHEPSVDAPYLVSRALFRDRLETLEAGIDEFEKLLDEKPDPEEAALQAFLTANPLLLDIYGQVIPKPNLTYPEGESPLGKKFVQPDFMVRRPGNRYRLIELERPSKAMATKQGQSRAEVGQAVFQIGEFKDFILEHYDRLKERYPGINRHCEATVVISRARAESFGGRSNVRRQLQLLQQQHSGIEELLTYDDLLDRAKAALAQLSGIGA